LTERIKVWGKGQLMKTVIPSHFSNPIAVAQFGKLEKLACSPGALKTIMMLDHQIDIQHILPSVRVPTLVLHRETDAQVEVIHGRKLASAIPGAKYIEYPSGDHAFWTGDTDVMLGDIEEFVTGTRGSSSAEQERLLATVLFTDVVDSTRQAAQLGDQRWKQLLSQHHDIAGQLIAKHRGTFIKSTGDGVLATFDGPARAVRCALATSAGAKQTGLPVRAGLHTGEIEISGKDIGGISVHAAARVMAQADPNEVLVSRVVTDLVAGAGLKFSERGSYELKGLSGRWDLFAATG
jgi:class 3 adenylate cyclase